MAVVVFGLGKNNVIISHIIGGLGNQMFQYALGRCLTLKRGVRLKLDVSGFTGYKKRKYELSAFNIQEDYANRLEILSFSIPSLWRPQPRVIKREHAHFEHEILALSGDVYLKGYWQSEKYFIEIEDVIRKEFTLKNPQSGKNLEVSRLIASKESVSLHVRRGDYVSEKKTRDIHGVCPLGYYKRSVEYMRQMIKYPFFYIFSDDFEWVHKNLKLSNDCLCVEFNSNSHEDLRLMSQCKHHITANSSFSWWGAWLNPRKNKIVLSPDPWFKDPLHNPNDIIPSEWIKIPVSYD